MMDLWRSLNGMVTVQVISADPSSLLTALNDAGIPIFQTVKVDDLTIQLTLNRKDYRTASRIIEKRGERQLPKDRMGLYWSAKHILRRPVLMLGILLLFALTCFIPTRIWFVNVEGNHSLPTKQILEHAAQCGIRFGASRRDVRSERMKNSLLESLPQLQWAGVNTSGCVATISVREKEQAQYRAENSGVSSIVSACDGVILSCTVTKGSAVCSVGQAVKAGELLISGYTD